MRDLTFLEEASVLNAQANVINFQKCRQIAGVFADIARLQEFKYEIVPDFALRDFLTNGFTYVEEDEIIRLATFANQDAE